MTDDTEEKFSFHTTDVEVLPIQNQETAYEKWLLGVTTEENKFVEHISYIFCSDDYLLDINKRYLNHDFYTDIITFPYQQGEVLESDIFISTDRVKENARLFNIPFEEELRRVMVHGVLHLMGYDDHAEDKEREMRQKEEYYIQQFLNN